MDENEKKIIDLLTMIAEGLQEDSWDRLERARKKFEENQNWKWLDYQQGVIHGVDEGAQRIYYYIEKLKNHEILGWSSIKLDEDS